MLDLNQQLRTRVAYHSESDAIPVARANGITTVGVAPGGGIFGGEVAGHEPRRLDVGRSDAQAERRHPVQLPGARRRRRARRRRWRPRRRRPAAGTHLRRHASASATAGSTRSIRLFDQARAYAKAGAGQDRRLDARSARPGRRAPAAAHHHASAASRTSATPSRSPSARRSTSSSAAAPRPSYVAPLLKEKNIPVILGNVLALPSREDDVPRRDAISSPASWRRPA